VDALSKARSKVPIPSIGEATPVLLTLLLEKLADIALSVRLNNGDWGISCSCGRGWNPVMQSTTSTLAVLFEADIRLGRWVDE
jgi:hypothetical protein